MIRPRGKYYRSLRLCELKALPTLPWLESTTSGLLGLFFRLSFGGRGIENARWYGHWFLPRRMSTAGMQKRETIVGAHCVFMNTILSNSNTFLVYLILEWRKRGCTFYIPFTAWDIQWSLIFPGKRFRARDSWFSRGKCTLAPLSVTAYTGSFSILWEESVTEASDQISLGFGTPATVTSHGARDFNNSPPTLLYLEDKSSLVHVWIGLGSSKMEVAWDRFR